MITIEDSAILKYQNEDFRVTEVSLVLPDLISQPKNNYHSVITIQKTGYTTFEAMKFIAEFFQVDKNRVHCQGLKDEDGITKQLISVHCITPAKVIERFNKKHSQLPKGWIKAEALGYAKEPLQEKSLHGNLFDITLRGVSASQADKLIAYCKQVPDFICANYYDQQRFGLPGGPYIAHKIGRAIVENDWNKADKLYRKSGNLELDFPGQKKLPATVINKIDFRKLDFFVSAYNSFKWNDELSKLIPGNAYIDIFDSYKVKAMTKNTASAPLTLSINGYTLREDLGIGTRQKARSSFISTTIFTSNKRPDSFFPKKHSLNLQFFLPTGSYATMLVKQLWHVTSAD